VKRVAAALLLAACTAAQALPSFEQVKAAHPVSDLTLLDRHGQPLQTLRVDMTVRRLPWVPLDQMSPALLQAVVTSEDKRFWQHSGVDWAAVAQSAFGNLLNTRTRGASTLTMQLAGLIDDGLARPAQGRSVVQKLGQVVVAAQLERSWTKSQILEAYLNSVPWRGEVVGINALAQTLFGKHVSGLDLDEAAIAAALVRGPNASPDRVGERACGVLQGLKQTCDGVRTLAAQALLRRPQPLLGEQLAPHYARLALRRDGPAQQGSSLDAGLQRVAQQALRQQLAELQGRNVEDGAVVVLDNRSGQVLAWVGANGDSSAAAQVDGVLARRQPGSTLKPFVYGLAFERRLITPASLLDDSPAEIATAAGLYLPQTYDRVYKGLVSARTALGASLNVPAVRVAGLLPPDALHARLNALGLDLRESGGWYGASLALGSAEVTLLGLANAYRTLANGGLYTPPALPGRPSAAARRVADAAASFVVADILADNNARVRTFGLDSQLRTRGWAAVKTGTSKDLRDNWCLGFTDRYTVGVWVGNASGAPMHDVSGISGAAPVWQALVSQLHRTLPSRPPLPPAGVQAARAVFDGHREATRDEWFVAGTAPRSTLMARSAASVAGISSPTDGAIYALDPDMPAAAQRIRFEGEAGTWVLDGRVLGRGRQLQWAPRPGRHVLALRDERGRLLQQLGFEVRGLQAPMRPPSSRVITTVAERGRLPAP
jgi:penicillin-binding protein 1C